MAGHQHRAVREHYLQPDTHRLDLAVARAVLPGAATRDPSADRGDVEALWEVTDRHRAALTQLRLEIGSERAGPHLDHAGDGIDVDDALHRGEIQHDTAEGRYRCTRHAAAPACSSDRHCTSGTLGEHGNDLLGGGRSADCAGSLGDGSIQRPVHRKGPPVAARLGGCGVAGDRLADRLQPRDQRVVGLMRRVGKAVGGAGQFDWRGRLRHRLTPSRSASDVCAAVCSAAHELRNSVTCRCTSAASHPSSSAISRATSPAASMVAGRSNRRERVRRDNTSSKCHRHLGSCRVHRFGLGVGEAWHERLCEARVGCDEGGHLGSVGSVSIREMGSGRLGRAPVAVGTDELQALGVGFAAHTQHLADHVDGVLGHLAVGRQLAADHRRSRRCHAITSWRRDRSAVRPDDARSSRAAVDLPTCP